jgi:hypothetical protein
MNTHLAQLNKLVDRPPPNNMEGHRSMKSWDPSWSTHTIPVPIKKIMRRWSAYSGIGRDYSPENMIMNCGIWPNLFDHWGAIKAPYPYAISRGVLITQPYRDCDEEAKSFAEAFKLLMVKRDVGVWHHKTRMYAFLPNMEDPAHR